MSDPFTGEIRIMPYSFSPRSWATCDGRTVSIEQNEMFYAVIRDTYGGDGSTYMALPNLNGRVPMGRGHGPGLTYRQIGQTGGSETVQLSSLEMPRHKHVLYATKNTADQKEGESLFLAAQTTARNAIYHDAADSTLNSHALSSIGGGEAHENRQPFLSLQFCICLDGLWPSRD